MICFADEESVLMYAEILKMGATISFRQKGGIITRELAQEVLEAERRLCGSYTELRLVKVRKIGCKQ